MTAAKAKPKPDEAWAACDVRVLSVLERIAVALERLAVDAPLVPATRAHVEGLGLSALQTAQVAAPPVSLTEKEPPCPSRATAATTAATPTSATSSAHTATQPAISTRLEGAVVAKAPGEILGAAKPSDPDSKPSALAEACTGPVVDLGEDTRDVPSTHDLWVRFPFADKAELDDVRACCLALPGAEQPNSAAIKSVKALVSRALAGPNESLWKAAWDAHVEALDAKAPTPEQKIRVGPPAVWKLCAIVWAVPVAQLDGSAVS